MQSVAIATVLAFAGAVAADCSRVGSVKLTFFGFPDNDPPSANTAYNCGGRNYQASGTATGAYNDPLTMASAQGEFNSCEIIYVPYLEKYVRYEDYCQQCTDDYGSGQRHIDVYTGSNTDGGQAQINCENSLTPNDEIVIVRNPATNLQVDTAPLYHSGTSNPCRTNHVYPGNKAHTYCP